MNIIYVDDEKMQLENFRLTANGLKGMESLQLFNSSPQAYEWAKKHQVDVAFLDIEMPHISGMKLAESLKALNPDVKIIFVTAYDQYAVKAIESELENVLYGTSLEKKVCITTMPDFLVTVNGKNIFSGHSKQEELFALLVHRGKSGVTKGMPLPVSVRKSAQVTTPTGAGCSA